MVLHNDMFLHSTLDRIVKGDGHKKSSEKTAQIVSQRSVGGMLIFMAGFCRFSSHRNDDADILMKKRKER